MSEPRPGLWFRGALAALLGVLATALAHAALNSSSSVAAGAEAMRLLDQSGVESPVTAVLLNFRGYDTFLELTVLTLTLYGVWSSPDAARPGEPPAPRILSALLATLLPVMLVVAVFLLWAGASRAGGAFHAGAVLASAAILAMMTGPAKRVPPTVTRAGVVVGPLVFAAVGLWALLSGGAFLDFPPEHAHAAILLIEAVSAVSIGLILAGLFAAREAGDT